jgi:hypothetical protein
MGYLPEMINRRNFFSRVASGFGAIAMIPSSTSCHVENGIAGKLMGPNAALGHRLRSMNFPKPSKKIVTDILIIGGGVAGLSAARYLKKHTNDFLLIELENSVGGNSIGGASAIGAYPWGAHYLPVPNQRDNELINFLRETDVISGFQNSLPVFNEYHLCHDPKERLYINHFWQEGLVPHAGVPEADRAEIERFLSMMHEFKIAKGDDGRDAFDIPIDFSSRDEKFIALDKVSANAWLAENNFSSSFLTWYIQYCCADDYGSSLNETSAWAMAHYFASRKGSAFNAPQESILTWPEGNYWLIKKLAGTVKDNIMSRTIAYDVALHAGGVSVSAFHEDQNSSIEISAKHVIMATPQFINQPLLRKVDRTIDYSKFQYAPWMVANITVKDSLGEKRGEPLSWDNVIYGSDAVGYVNAANQYVGVQNTSRVITYYKPLVGDNVHDVRMDSYRKKFDDWKEIILKDLQAPHPNIKNNISNMDIWVWGHGMIRPSPSFIWSENRLKAREPVLDKLWFAHSDLSGISIFEEAFYHGHTVAKKILDHGTT